MDFFSQRKGNSVFNVIFSITEPQHWFTAYCNLNLIELKIFSEPDSKNTVCFIHFKNQSQIIWFCILEPLRSINVAWIVSRRKKSLILTLYKNTGLENNCTAISSPDSFLFNKVHSNEQKILWDTLLGFSSPLEILRSWYSQS
jgi:hypothetical protein